MFQYNRVPVMMGLAERSDTLRRNTCGEAE